MFRIILSLFFILFFFSSMCSSDDFSVMELIRGVNQARLSIQNGEVQYISFYNHEAQKSEKEIAAWMQAEKEKALKDFTPDPFFPDIGVREFEVQYLIPMLDFRATREREWTEFERISMAFHILAPNEMNFPKLYQYKMTIEEKPGITLERQAARFPQPGLFYSLSYDTQLQVREDVGNIISSTPSIRTWSSDYHAGFHHLWAFGRSAYHVPDSAKHIGKEYIDGAECHILAFEIEDDRHARIWIDPEKSFCIRRVEVRPNPELQVVETLGEFKEFRRFSDLWYPTVVQHTSYSKKGDILNSYGFKIIFAEFNVNFPKNFFRIDGDFYQGQRPRANDVEPSGLGSLEILPQNDAENLLLLCGPESLLRICEILKVKTSLRELKKLSNFHPNRGTTMLGLKKAAAYKGLAPTGVRASLNLLKKKKIPFPAIAYVNGNHFLVFETVNKNGVEISDPAQKYPPHLTWEKLVEIWDGELLIFDKKKARTQKQEPVPLAFTEAPEYDFGKALGGSQINHIFTIKNIGQKPLKILSVTETCACTVSVLTQDEIPPEGTGNISTVLTVPSGNVEVRESLLVLTDDPTQSTLTLTLKGHAFIPLTTFPEHLAFGNQKPLQEPLTKQISLHLQEDVQILGVRTDSEHLKATLEIANGIRHVDVQLLPSIPVGMFSQHLLIDYRYQGQQTIHDIIVFGEVLGELQVTPKRLFFGMIKEPSTVSKTITISARDAQPFKITSVEPPTKGVVFTLTTNEDKTRTQVTVSIVPTAKPGELSGDVVIHTSSAIQPILRVPFFGILADAN